MTEEVSELAFGKVVVGYMTNCYIIGSRASREAICIDPFNFRTEQADKILSLAADLGVVIKRIVSTHGHFDHVIGVNEIVEKTAAPFLLHRADLPLLTKAHNRSPSAVGKTQPIRQPDFHPQEGDLIEVEGLQLLVLETPGHTPGSICLFCPDVNVLFSGDTLFAGAVGITRPGDFDTEMRSIAEKLFQLPDETIVQPGHQKATTIRYERFNNYSVRSWIEDQENG